MSHLLTGIPIGSRVVCLAMKRFAQEKFSARTGAIRVDATPSAYPVMIQVRPGGGGAIHRTPTGLRNFGPVSQATMRPEASGDVIDFVLRSPTDKQEPGTPEYWQTRHSSRAMVRAVEVRAALSPDTDIYDRIFCERCNDQLVSESGKVCTVCEPVTDPLCTAMKRTEAGPYECQSLRHPGLEVCRQHAEEQGLIAPPQPAVPDADRCVWSACTAARFKTFVMCAEHAYEAGLLAPAAEPVAAVATPKAKAKRVRARSAKPRRDPLAPRKRGGVGPHKPDCQCFICIRGLKIMETPEVLVAAGKAEAEEPGR